MPATFDYYAVDWLAMLLTFAAIYLLGNKRREGFLTMICGNACWIGVAVMAGSSAMIAANAVFIAMNGRGWWRWSRDEGAVGTPS